MQDRGSWKVNSKDLFNLATQINNELCRLVRDLYEQFRDNKDLLKSRVRAAKWR